MEFKRHQSAIYPQIYAEFKVTLPGDDNCTEFVIQDLTDEFIDEAVEVIVENHARGAVFHRAAGTLTTDEGLQKARDGYRRAFEEKISLICLVKGTKTVVGCNAMGIWTKDNLKMPQTHLNDNFKVLNLATNYIVNAFDIFGHYHVDKFVYAYGLCVKPEYRRCGIATEILRARAPLLRSINVKLTTTVFSTVGAQKAAFAAGYEENYSIDYEKFEKLIPGSNFSHVYGLTCKVMSLMVE